MTEAPFVKLNQEVNRCCRTEQYQWTYQATFPTSGNTSQTQGIFRIQLSNSGTIFTATISGREEFVEQTYNLNQPVSGMPLAIVGNLTLKLRPVLPGEMRSDGNAYFEFEGNINIEFRKRLGRDSKSVFNTEGRYIGGNFYPDRGPLKVTPADRSHCDPYDFMCETRYEYRKSGGDGWSSSGLDFEMDGLVGTNPATGLMVGFSDGAHYDLTNGSIKLGGYFGLDASFSWGNAYFNSETNTLFYKQNWRLDRFYACPYSAFANNGEGCEQLPFSESDLGSGTLTTIYKGVSLK